VNNADWQGQLKNYPRFVIEQGAAGYPQRLDILEKPPAQLHLIGAREVLDTPALAIVGARKATPYGLSCAHHFAARAARRGITVVSGGAIGCDQASHRGALEAGGPTIIVAGCGADVVYPKRAAQLFCEVASQGGAIVAEAPWGSSPTRWGFSLRNRIIAALAQATLIVEAGLPSGTFQTADATIALGYEVLAVPGAIHSPESRGSNRLIKQGALPVVDDESFDDALDQLFGPHQCHLDFGLSAAVQGPQAQAASHSVASDEAIEQQSPRDRIIPALTAQPMHPDELAQYLGCTVLDTIRLLSALELEGGVEKLRDGRFTCLRT
jgi:DNA processing protein